MTSFYELSRAPIKDSMNIWCNNINCNSIVINGSPVGYTQTIIVQSPQEELVFQGFPSNGNRITVTGVLQTSSTFAFFDYIDMAFNASGNSYSWMDSSGEAVGNTYAIRIAVATSSTAAGNHSGVFSFNIQGYSGALIKGVAGQSGITFSDGLTPFTVVGNWNDADPITRITLSSETGANFLIGSSITLSID